ncbi:fructosamine kinase family protein [[Pseudopropionibacterium] massiliense]|uniref:fructosamine kinase family protein n=1 Tax=[Pseudopropionibacterium] massiliense TaxID=2220000 RepID=UPI00102F73D8|nr:fructosamine kinase family protein [[Pseudopropionibacterium] massiliense]
MSFHKSGSPAAIATEVTSLFWLAGVPGGAAVAEVVNRGQSWLETRRLAHGTPSPEDAARFGRRLARTHAAGASHWGAPPPGLRDTDARLAELPAPVSHTSRWNSWGEFYAEARLRPYLRLAEVPREARLVLHRAIDLVAEGRFDAPQPALVGEVARIHGDLWAGNVMWAITSGGKGTTGTLLDPSAHGGHAETDLAELALFRAPHLDSIIAGYQEVSPLADGWRHRVSVHQFHMVLVHAALYSGNYIPQALTLARRLRGDAERSRRQPVRIGTADLAS